VNRLAWWLPDLAFVAAAVTLFYCLFLFQGYGRLFRDSDAGWHIRNGETILATRELPMTDPYSFTRAGQPWYAWEWAADVAVGAVHRAAGLTGVALFYAAAIAAGVWLWFQLHWALDGSFLIAGAMAPLLLSTTNLHWLARPHVLSWLFLLLAVWWAERRQGDFGWRQAAAVAAFTALWANVHASFFFAPAIALVYAARDRRFLWAAAVAAVAPLANPYGWRLYQHVFRYLTDSELLSHVGEFQSFDFHAAGAGQIIAALILGMTGGGLALAARRWEHFALAVLFTALALRSARALPLAALVLLPLANAAITQWLGPCWLVDYSNRLRSLDARFRGVALSPLVLAACFALLRAPAIAAATGFPPSQFPVAAYSHLPQGGRLFAPDMFGGYLIYRYQGECAQQACAHGGCPQGEPAPAGQSPAAPSQGARPQPTLPQEACSAGSRKVFFDGRSDLYGAAFLKAYARMVQVRPGWREYWESFHFTAALVPDDWSLIPALEQIGWTPVYRDATATLLVTGQVSGGLVGRTPGRSPWSARDASSRCWSRGVSLLDDTGRRTWGSAPQKASKSVQLFPGHYTPRRRGQKVITVVQQNIGSIPWAPTRALSEE
jgi:hypothetical protein